MRSSENITVKKMAKKSSIVIGPSASLLEWDPKSKEQWFTEFEKEPVNDNKWSCIVTAAIPSEAEDEECIQTYAECVNLGLRKSLKIISMSHIMKLLKFNTSSISIKKEGKTKGRNSLPEKTPRAPSVIEFVRKYATFTDTECILPPDLMAVLIKHIILSLKNESIFQKKVDAVRERKIREQNIKAKFIRDLKPYELRQVDDTSTNDTSSSSLEMKEPIKDEPIDGPDLYIMLTDFYDPLYFPALQTINVPFLAILKISMENQTLSFNSQVEFTGRKTSLINSFWNNLNEYCDSPKTTPLFKDIAVMEYQAPLNAENTKKNIRITFDELTWMQYSAGYVQRQYKKYLKQLHVQRVVQSLEPLDLSTCEVYNKLCDALVTGEPLTPLLVLYAIVEQVVVGVPQTKSAVLEYERKFSEPTVPRVSESFSERAPILVTPCLECRDKKFENICNKLKEKISSVENPEILRDEDVGKNSKNSEIIQIQRKRSKEESSEEISLEFNISKSLIEKSLTERKTEKEIREEKTWKTPKLCFYDDFVFLQSLHCDPQLFCWETAVDRFLKNANFFQIWAKYPVLPAGEKAFSDFHFFNLWKLSGLTEEILKLKIFFILAIKLIYKTEALESDVNKKPQMNLSKGQFDQNFLESGSFRNFFFKTFIIDKYFRLANKSDSFSGIEEETTDRLNTRVQNEEEKEEDASPDGGCCATACFQDPEEQFSPTNHDRVFLTLHSLLDCFEISNLTEPRFIKKTESSPEIIQNFKIYEKLESNLMIQRLMEVKNSFNTIHCSYFAPTDTLGIIMHNDYDYRGIFTTFESGVLSTPVCFRDFYRYVYSEIGTWLIEENTEHSKFVSEVEERLKAKEEKKDAVYLSTLKRQYCGMSESQREEFLTENVEVEEEPEVKKKELEDLQIKPKPDYPSKISFLTTNFSYFRVQNNKEVKEFHSQDGTRVSLTTDSWLYSPEGLLKLVIKRSKFFLYYYQWMNKNDLNCDFTFKTDTDIIFAFHKNSTPSPDRAFNYNVGISWPTGLLINSVPQGRGIYIKQSYLKPYRRGWDIENENSRCFLDNGRVIILKENGDYDVLFGSGRKISYYDSQQKFETFSTTGEVWQIPTKGPCKNKKKLITNNKILIGVDPKTEEKYYKREDGVMSMLWPDGTLVTNYPDGTKITATPDFDLNEVTVEWTEEEKMYFTELQMNYKSEHMMKETTRTILRNSTSPRSISKISVNVDSFVSVSCTYLMEHPKYSRIYYSPIEPYVTVTMQENLKILMYPQGNYEIQQENETLSLYDDEVEFFSNCNVCTGKSSVTLNLNSSEILCRCVDYFRRAFFVYRDGRTRYEERYTENEEEFTQEPQEPCSIGHEINPSLRRRCFILERNLSGFEFLHEDFLALNGYQLPEEAFNDSNDMCHTFNIPHYKIGYEKWMMNYEEENNSLPKNLKKKDLKEMGVKQVPKNLFKYPFPKHHNCEELQRRNKERTQINEPKVIVVRTVRCLSPNPETVITEMRKIVATYQEKARRIFNAYINHRGAGDRSQDSRYVKMRLRKIALTLSQSLQMYPHLCTNLPSTEKEIHYFGHFIKSWETMKSQVKDSSSVLSDCKQIPIRFPRKSDFPCIYEESESPHESR